MIDGAQFSRALVVTATERWAVLLRRDRKVETITLAEVEQGQLQGRDVPLVLDNEAVIHLLGGAKIELLNLEAEVAEARRLLGQADLRLESDRNAGWVGRLDSWKRRENRKTFSVGG